MNKFFLLIFCVLTLPSCSQINLGKIQKASDKAQDVLFGSNKTTLSQDEIIKGLREALILGAEKSTQISSKPDGFYKNSLLYIPFPEDATKVKEVAGNLGMQAQIEKFEMTLNRAAEEASKKAAPIFIDAIQSFSIQDGLEILRGPDDAATQYLNKTTKSPLYKAFKPVVEEAINKVELTKYWKPLISKYNTATFLTGGQEINTDLSDYITQRAIAGLFVHIAEEEKNIRDNPAARVSEILQKVFGSEKTKP